MEELELEYLDSVETAVNKLLKAKSEGRHVFCNFNGTKLFSDIVTMDSAYVEIHGCTKKEWEKKREKAHEELVKSLEELKNLAINNIPNQIEKGKVLIYPFRHDEWTRLVVADATGDYCGDITENALEIMRAIEEKKPMKEILKIFKKQGHSGWSSSVTRIVVMTYSKNGYPFYKASHYGKWTLEECEGILKIMKENEDNNNDLKTNSNIIKSKNEVATIQKKLVRNS